MGGEIRVLGPLTVEQSDDERSQTVAVGPAQRRLLAMLCASPGNVVSVDQLQDGLGLASAVSVRSTVSRLKRLVGDVVRHEPPGYVVDADAMDASRFRRLLTEARGADLSEAVSAYDTALALWRGAAFGEFADEEWAMGEAAWLDQARVAAREERIDAVLAVSRVAEAVADAERLVVDHPLRERPRAQLMRSLTLDGRQTEALRVFHDFRRFLADEIGTTPSDELVELEQQIVTGRLTSGGRDGSSPVPPETRRGNLQNRLSSFVGRTTIVTEVSQLVADKRLVTLTGPGGVGKTRLAVEVAARSADKFADGVWLAELGVVADGAGIADLVMAALGLQPGQGETSAERIFGFLADRCALIVIDNCEHVLAEAGHLVNGILQRAPETKVITTSREPLMIDGERILPVPPLTIDADGETGGEAVELFVERVLSSGAQLTLDDSTLRTAAEICDRLDGLPLAIELAASRCRSMGLRDVALRLDERFQLLTGGGQAVDERHRTLQATVDWSYELLSDVERLVFDRLSVFAGWFSLEDAVAVTSQGEVGDQAAVDALSSLVDKSMCVLNTSEGTGSYRLLETMRAYGQANLDAAGLLEATRRTHAEHYRDVLVAANREFVGPDEAEVLKRCVLIAPELRAGLHWAAKAGEIDLAMGYLPVIAHFGWRSRWAPHGWVAEVAHLLPRTPMVLACQFGHTMSVSNDYLRCRDLLAEAIALDDPSPDMAYTYAMGGWNEVSLGEFEDANRLTRIGCELGEAGGESLHAAVARFFHAEVRMSVGLDDGGIGQRLFDQGTELNWPSARAAGLYLLAHGLAQSDPAKACELLAESLEQSALAGKTGASDMARLLLLELQVAQGSLKEAGEIAIHIFKQYSVDGLAGWATWAAAGVAVLLTSAGNHGAAATVGGFAMSHSDGFTVNRQVEKALDHSRAELGDEFSTFERRGQAMTMKELIEYTTVELQQIVE